MTFTLLKADNLYKSYASHQAVKNFSLQLKTGEICALIGQNGAGKSSILRMLSGIFLPDSGKIELNTQKKIGYLPEERGLYQNMKVLEHLQFLVQLRGINPKEARKLAEEALDKFGLTDWKNRSVKQLSKGMQQKVQILGILLHDPDILILDEPFSGLDPVSMSEICNLFSELKKQEKAIIVSTHEMYIAEEISDNLCLIKNGDTLWQGKTKELATLFGDNVYTVCLCLSAEQSINWPTSIQKFILGQKQISAETLYESKVLKTFELKIDDTSHLPELLNFLSSTYSIHKFEKYSPRLEDAFKRLVLNSN